MPPLPVPPVISATTSRPGRVFYRLIVSVCVATSPALGMSPLPVQPRLHVAAEQMPAVEIRRLAREAYVWGWPLAYVHHCRLTLERVPVPGRSGGMPVAPINRLAMLSDRVVPRNTIVPCPNQDVIYGFGMFDLAATPVVVQVPDFGPRFWLYQLGDQRTDGFAQMGSMYGTQPGCHLVVGPGWSGQVPPGIAGIVRCPTRYAYCLPRVFFSAAAGDREAALPAVNRIMAYPLDEFDGGMRDCDWSKARWLPNIGKRTTGVSPQTFFETLPKLLDDVPPLPDEERLYADLRRLVATIDRDPSLARLAAEAAGDAERDVVAPLFEFRNVGRPLAGNWTTIDNGAAFGTDYVTRTAVARSNVFVNRQRETKYFFLDLDSRGERLRGDRDYRITFPAGALPPARAFWSLTVYDERHALPAEPTGTYAIGSRNGGLKIDPDGSLTITLSRKPPDALAGNRLTAPEGHFSLYMRLYWPQDPALDGSWTPPPVILVSTAPDRSGGPQSSPTEAVHQAPTLGTSQFLAASLKCVDSAGCGETAAGWGSEKYDSASLTGQLGGTPWVSAAARMEQEARHAGVR